MEVTRVRIRLDSNIPRHREKVGLSALARQSGCGGNLAGKGRSSWLRREAQVLKARRCPALHQEIPVFVSILI